MLRQKSVLLFCLILLASHHGQILRGQSSKENANEKGPAFTEPPNDDWTYALMGEFVGSVKHSGKKQLLGLQIRSIGVDQFDAVAFLGGLPGQKQHQREPFRLIGKRSGEFVVLSGGPWAIFVEQNTCRLIDLQGNKVGQLKRVKRKSPTLYANPPEGATVLFDRTNTDQFVKAEMTNEGLLMEGADVKPMFQDFNLHVEFRLPYMPQADGQKRGNSGLYLQSRYECQVLDSFAQTSKIDGCGALYRFKAPDLNMCFPPLVWQTYDVQFTAPRWSADGTKIRSAHISSWINGIKVQDNVALANKTGAGKPEGAFLSPMKIQNHGDPVRFRNIWIVDRGLTISEFPIIPTKSEIQQAVRAQQQQKKQRLNEARIRAAAAKLEVEKSSSSAAQPDSAVEDDKSEIEKSKSTKDDKNADTIATEKKNRPQNEKRRKPKQDKQTPNQKSELNQDSANIEILPDTN